jgi:excisionase family DNA binding protein
MTDTALVPPCEAPAESSRPQVDGSLLSVAEVAERLRVHPSTIYRQLKRGSFPVRAFRVERCWRIDAFAFDRWMATS